MADLSTPADRTISYDAGEAIFSAEEARISELFVDPLRYLDPKVSGVVQRLDWHMVRQRLRRVVDSDRFWFSMHSILLLNTVVMLVFPRESDNDLSGQYIAANTVLIVILAISILEMIVYCLAYGVLWDKQSTLTDTRSLRLLAVISLWAPPRLKQSLNFSKRNRRGGGASGGGDANGILARNSPLLASVPRIVESLLLLLSVIGYIIPTDNPSHILRYLHGFRSLRLLTVPFLLDLSETLVQSSVMLVSSTTFVMFVFIVFDVLSIDPFSGALASRCVTIDYDAAMRLNVTVPSPLPAFLTTSNFCTASHPVPCMEADPPLACSLGKTKPEWFLSRVCPPHMACRELSPPNYGYTNFDNFANAWLTILQVTSLSNWSDVMYGLFSVAHPAIAGAYFFGLIVVTAFILFNVVTAVVSSSYAKVALKAKQASQRVAKNWLLRSEFDRFLHWRYSETAARHLTFDAGVRQANGEATRSPFVNEPKYQIVTDIILAVVVGLNAANDAYATTEYRSALRTVEIVYATFQFLELFLSLLAHGCLHEFFSQRANAFEVAAAMATVLGLSINYNLSYVRSLRFIRYVSHLGLVGTILSRSSASMLPTMQVCLYLGVVCVVFAGVYMQSFSPISTSDGSFRDFGDGASAILRTLSSATTDGWEQSMYYVMQHRHWTLGVLYMIPSYLLFGYVILSLFVAVMMNAFQPSDEEKIALQKQQYSRTQAIFSEDGSIYLKSALLSDATNSSALDGGDAAAENALRAVQLVDARQTSAAAAAAAGKATVVPGQESDDNAVQQPRATVQRTKKILRDKSFAIFGVDNPIRKILIRLLVDLDDVDPQVRRRFMPDEEKQSGQASLASAAAAESSDAANNNHEPTAAAGDNIGGEGAGGSQSKPPPLYGRFVHPFIMLVVLGSCIQLFFTGGAEACSSLDDSLDFTEQIFWNADIFFTVFFSVEALAKMIVHGVFFPGDDRPWYLGSTYLRDIWNLLDFGLLACMIAAFFLPQARALRVLRALRPLRVIRRSERMREVISGVVSALPSVIILFLYLFYIIFVLAIVGVTLFAGKFHSCSEPFIAGQQVLVKSQCVGMTMNSAGVLAPVVWRPAKAHCDDIWSCVVFIVEIVTMSGWNDFLVQVSSTVGVGYQPLPNTAGPNIIFPLCVTLLVSFTFVNFVVGVLLFHVEAHKGVLLLTRDQRDWFFLVDDIRSMKPIPAPPPTRFPRLLRFVTSNRFDTAINVAIFLNICLLASVHYKQSAEWSTFQFALNLVFLAFFSCEIILKVIAMGLVYFKSIPNMFDVLVVVGSIVEISVDVASGGGNGVAVTSVIRTFRIARVARGLRRVEALRSMFLMLMRSALSLISLIGLLIVVLILWAVIGMTSFGNVRFGVHITRNANFRYLDTAFLLMLRLLTLDRWNDLMHEYRDISGAACSGNQPGWQYIETTTGNLQQCGTLNDCGTFGSQFFFLSMVFFGSFFLMSVIIAILLDNFNYISAQTRIPIRLNDLDRFKVCWRRAKRSIGIEEHYNSVIEPEFLSSLVMDLFNDGSAIVNSAEGVTIHPVLTATTRLNFKKLVCELKAIARLQHLPADGFCTFHNVLITCARMQFGRRGLTIRQTEEREALDVCIVQSVAGEAFSKNLQPCVDRARQRIAERNAAKAVSASLEAAAVRERSVIQSLFGGGKGGSASKRFAIPGGATGPSPRRRISLPPFATGSETGSTKSANGLLTVPTTSPPPVGLRSVPLVHDSPPVNSDDENRDEDVDDALFATSSSSDDELSDSELMSAGEGSFGRFSITGVASVASPDASLRGSGGGVRRRSTTFAASGAPRFNFASIVEEQETEARRKKYAAFVTAQETVMRQFVLWIECDERGHLFFGERAAREALGEDIRLGWFNRLRSPPPEEEDNDDEQKQGQDLDEERGNPSEGGHLEGSASSPLRSGGYHRRQSAVESSSPMNPVAANFPLPMCPRDMYCPLYGDVAHMVVQRHTCREAVHCSQRGNREHERFFLHPADGISGWGQTADKR